MTSSNKCAKNVHVLYMYKYGPLRSLHGHGAWRLFFFGIFKVGIHGDFLQASVDFQKTYGGHLEGCLHGELYVFSSREKFQLCHLDRVESCPGMSFIPGSSCKPLYAYVYEPS